MVELDGAIRDVFTDRGDIKIIVETEAGANEERSVWSDKDLEQYEKHKNKGGAFISLI